MSTHILFKSANLNILNQDYRLVEAHHRITNSLAQIAGSVRLQAASVGRQDRAMTPAEARTLLEEVGARIEAVARLHRLLSSDADGQIDLGDYVCATCEALETSISAGSGLEMICDAQDMRIDADRAQIIGLMVTELVINAMKYAHPAGAPGRIEIRCRSIGPGTLMLSVTDDGVGLPDGFDPATDGGVGLRVVRSMAGQLGADLEFESNGLGLKVTVALQTPLCLAVKAQPFERREAIGG